MTRRSRIRHGVLAMTAFTWMLVSPASTLRAAAQAGWPFKLEWTQDQPAAYFKLCVNDTCSVLASARRTQGTTWQAPLPPLPPGEYRLVVEACAGEQCLPGSPDLVIRVLQPSSRRPPITVLDGPRIPLPR